MRNVTRGRINRESREIHFELKVAVFITHILNVLPEKKKQKLYTLLIVIQILIVHVHAYAELKKLQQRRALFSERGELCIFISFTRLRYNIECAHK